MSCDQGYINYRYSYSWRYTLNSRIRPREPAFALSQPTGLLDKRIFVARRGRAPLRIIKSLTLTPHEIEQSCRQSPGASSTMARDLDASSSAQALPGTADSSRGHLNKPADAAHSIADDDSKVALAVPKQAMAAALGPSQASEVDTETGDVPMPWWYTPRRLLVRHLTQALWCRMCEEAGRTCISTVLQATAW